MEQDEVPRILDLLDRAIHLSRRSRREIERTLGLGQGYLGSLLKGRIELKVRHVYVLARELGLDPLSFFTQASSPKESAWLQQLGAPAAAPAAAPPPQPPAEEAPLTRGEVEDLVRKTLREELARLEKGTDGRDRD
jgi:transcriptional regulator with XRE-family HTH domain